MSDEYPTFEDFEREAEEQLSDALKRNRTASMTLGERAFAWTATSGYKLYPPYVNLTGNRLVVRNPPTFGQYINGETGPIEGVTVAIDLPDEAIAELTRVLAADAIETAEKALEQMIAFGEEVERKCLVGDEGCYWPVESARAALTKLRDNR